MCPVRAFWSGPPGFRSRPIVSQSTSSECTAFSRDGFAGPIPLLDRSECGALARHIDAGRHAAPLDWFKGRAPTDPLFHSLAARAALLDRVAALVGDDVVLWGCQVVRRQPGQQHLWHCDVESAAPEGGFVTVWIGLRGTSRRSALQVIPGSHRFGVSIQESCCRRDSHGLGPDDSGVDAETALDWAREHQRTSELREFDMTDGDALFFDGRLWHGSHNRNSRRERVAVLLQYAAASKAVRIPVDFHWPFRYQSAPLPPAILMRGTDHLGRNRLVPPPPPAEEQVAMLTTAIRPIPMPLAEDAAARWKPYPMFRGPTRTVGHMTCHVSVLSAGHSPHPPHSHEEEELLVVLDGDPEILIATAPDDPQPRIETLSPGQFVFYPPLQHHTIRNPTARPVTYLMFKWRAGASATREPLGTSIFDWGRLAPAGGSGGFATERVFEQGTKLLGKLHAHVTELQPGGGYGAHVDAHDVAIILVSGTVETLGETVGPQGVIYYSAGERHGMHNPGTTPARYLVFEFHSPGALDRKRPQRRGRLRRGLSLLASPRRLAHAVKRRAGLGGR